MPWLQKVSCTLFVENLGLDMKKEELFDYFRKFGEIRGVSMPFNTMDKMKNKGYCFVACANMEVANNILGNSHTFKNRDLCVKPPNRAKRSSHKKYPGDIQKHCYNYRQGEGRFNNSRYNKIFSMAMSGIIC